MVKYSAYFVIGLSFCSAGVPALAQTGPGDDGVYVGVEVGAANHHFVLEETSPAGSSDRNVSRWGLAGGVIAGYDKFVSDRARVALEGAVNFGGKTASTTSRLGETFSINPRYGYSLTARVGYQATPSVLPYVGAGYGGHRYKVIQPAGSAQFDEWNRSFILVGGLEVRASARISVRLEAMHLDGTRNQVMLGIPIRF